MWGIWYCNVDWSRFTHRKNVLTRTSESMDGGMRISVRVCMKSTGLRPDGTSPSTGDQVCRRQSRVACTTEPHFEDRSL